MRTSKIYMIQPKGADIFIQIPKHQLETLKIKLGGDRIRIEESKSVAAHIVFIYIKPVKP